MIKNIRKEKITDVKRLDPDKVLYSGRAGPVTMIVKQPEPKDIWKVNAGAQKCSKNTIKRFTQIDMPTRKSSDKRTICDYPVFKRGDLGFLFVVMMIDGDVVGFGRHYYSKASEIPMYRIKNPDDVAAECALCIVDEYQGKGLGTLYGIINKKMCKDLGAQWLVGTTYTKGGMMKIRQRDGFDIVDILPDGKQCRVRGKL